MSRCSSRTRRACSTIRRPSPPSARSPALAKHLPERDPHPQLYYGALEVLGALDDAEAWPALLVRWEMLLLQDLGFGLDLSECAATGTDTDLIYVSPRSGRAVSRDAGQPYCDRLLKLPRFLLEEDARPRPPMFSPALRSPAISSSATCSAPTALRCRRHARASSSSHASTSP